MESMNTEGWLSLIEKSKSQLESNLSLDHWPCSLWRGQHSSGLPWAWGIQGSPLGSVYTQNHDTAPPGLVPMFVKGQKSLCASQGGAGHENHLQVCQLPVGLRLRPLLSSRAWGSSFWCQCLDPRRWGSWREVQGTLCGLKSEAQNSAAFHSIPTSGTSEQWKACLCRISAAYKFLYDLQDPHWTLHLLCFMCLLSHSTNIC